VIENNPMAVVEDLEIDAAFWRWAIEAKDTHIISFSSSAAYPIALQTPSNHRPLAETDIDLGKSLGIPDLTYGWAKLTSEYIGKLAHVKHGIKVACYRPFSGYGADQDLSYPFPAIMKRALEAKSGGDFIVWGSGLQERDFIHISDLVQNVLGSYKEIIDGSGVNLGTGIATNFKSLARTALSILGKDLQVKGMSQMPEGVFSRVADTTLSSTKYRMKSLIDLESGVKVALEYRSKMEL
jgi:GDP-L-fucose synthase